MQMRFKWFGSIASLLVAGAALAQAPATVSWTNTPDTRVEHLPPPNDLPSVTAPPPAPLPATKAPAPHLPCPTCPAKNESVATAFAAATDHYTSGSSADFWLNADYLVWWISHGQLPTLVGSIPITDAQAGQIGNITTLYGGGTGTLQYHAQSGLRLSTGLWLEESHTFGVDASFFQLEQKTQGGNFASPGDPVVGPVFYDPVQNRETIILFALPNFTSGPFALSPRSDTISIRHNNRLWGADLDGRYQIGALFFMDRLDLVAGFRHLNFGEGLDITSESISHAVPNPGPNILVSDHFGTTSQFYGGQVGLAAHGQTGRLSADFTFKFAMGDIHQAVDINGSTTFTTPGRPTRTNDGGILTQPTNIGHFSKDHFGVLPELTLTVGYQIMPHLRATVGYNVLYLSNVLRAADQIDGVDARQVHSLADFDPRVQATRPAQFFTSDHFYAQGLNFGLEFSF
jgi:hypothetical protein